MKERVKFDISTTAILKVVGIILGLWLLFLIRDVLVLFFIVLVIVAALAPVVDRWSKEVPRIVAVLFLYLAIIAVFAVAIFLIVPPVVSQIQQLSENLPDYLGRVIPAYQSWQEVVNISQQGLSNLSSTLTSLGKSLYSTTVSFFTGLIAAFTILVLTFYLLLEQEGIKKFFFSLLPISQKDRVVEIFQKIGLKMGSWLRGQLLLMLVVGLLDTIGLIIIGVPYWLALGLWAALTEVIPYIGPWIGLVPAVFVAFLVSPVKGALVLVVYILVQQIEAQFLVPKIMGKAVGLSPVIVIFAILVGAKLFGILGVVLAVPVAAVLSVVVHEWPEIRKLWGERKT